MNTSAPCVSRTSTSLAGTLALAGAGTPIEWALLMRRFPPGSLISEMAAVGNVPPGLGKALGEMAAAMHRRLAVVDDRAAPSRLAGVVASIVAHLDGVPQFAERGRRFATEVRVRLAAAMPLLENRVAAGRVRRCHGDLHLANLVWLYGQPIAFDAIEFDEALATIDVLYDIAFTLMDLERFGLAGEANALLNRWLWRSGLAIDLDGLALLPLLLSLRAGVRAMVTVDRAGQIEDAAARQTAHDEAAAYLDRALAYLTPPPPALIAVGGLSGTGKSTLAAALAPALGAAPGAVHLRSDLERKALFEADELDRLGAEAYGQPATRATYLRLDARAKHVLTTGHAVIVDAVFAREDERRAIADAAEKARVPFLGLWLAAPDDVLKQRVADRRGDASDATVAVVEAQLGRDAGEIDWQVIAAGGDADATLAEARRQIGIHLAEHLRAIAQRR